MKKIVNKKIISNLCITIFFLYMLDPFFINRIVVFNRLFYYFIAMIPLLTSLFCVIRKEKIVFNKDIWNFSLLFLIYVIWSFVLGGIIGKDLSYSIELIKLIFKIFNNLGLYLVWKWLYKKEKISASFENFVVNAVILYIISSLVFVVIPDWKQFWIKFIYNNRNEIYIIQMSQFSTRYGLAGWSSFAEAYMVLFASIYLFALYLKREISNIVFTIKLIFMVIGSFLYGRFALVIFLIMLTLFMVYTVLVQRKWWIVHLLMIVTGIGIIVISFLYSYSSTTKSVVLWIFEPVLSFFHKGTFAVNSTNELLAMYKNFAPDFKEWFVGSGKWNANSKVVVTDVGFMRNIYYGGIFYTGYTYFVDIFTIRIYKKYFSAKSRKNEGTLISLLLLIILITADLKGSMAVTFLRYLLPMLASAIYWKNTTLERT